MWRVRPRIDSLFIGNGCPRWPYRAHSSAGTSHRSSLRNTCRRGGAAPRWAPQSAAAAGRASRVVGPHLRYAAALDDEGVTAAARDVTPRGGAVDPRLHNSSEREGREDYWPSGRAMAGDPSCTIAKESATVGDRDGNSVCQQHPLPSTNGAAAGPEPSPQGSPGAAAAAGGMRSCREVHRPSCPGARVAYVRGPADGVASEVTTKLAAAASPAAQESAAVRRTVQLDDGETVSVRDDLVALRRMLPLQASQALTRLFADSGATASAYAAAALTSAENCGVRDGAQGSVKHRRRRQRAADRMEMLRGITHHPCRLQGGCRGQRSHSNIDIQISATSDSSSCAYLHHPAVSCVEELRTGHCALSREGRCPWVHGDLADRRHADVLAESWLLEADPVAREAVIRRLREGAPHVESILRIFVDVITAVVEEGPATVREAFRAADTAQLAGRLRCLRESLTSLRVGDDSPSWLQMIAAGSDTELPLLLQWSVVRQAVVDAPEWIPEAPPRHTDDASELEALWSEAEHSDAAVQAADGQKPFRATRLKDVERDLCRLWGSILILSPTQGTIGLSPLLTDWVLAEAAGVLKATKEQEEGDTTTAAVLPRAVAALVRSRWRESQEGSGRTRWGSILLLKDGLMLSALIAPSINSFSHPVLSAMVDDDGTALSSKMGAPTCLPSHFLSEVVLACCGSGQDASPRHHSAVELGGLSGGVFDVQWSAWHAFLLPLCAGLLRLGVRTLHACETGLLRLATLAAADTQALHGAALLTSVGWQPLTDAVMFAPAQAAAHTAATYARHHLPVVAPGCLNSLVNGFLSCVLGDAEYLHAWSPTSPVRCILRTPTVESTTDITSLRAWLQRQRRCDYKTRAHFLQGHIAAALMFLSALEALGQDVLQQQSHNSEDFERRRETYRASTTAHHHGHHRQEGRQHRSRKHLTNRSYPSLAEEQAANAIHPMSLLLPHGTPAVSARNTALLVRLLLEGGQSYRSMRLCVSIARVNRMVRSAMKVPLPEIVSSYKMVHKMSRGAKTNRKHVRRIRMPTLRVRTSMESETRGDEDAEVVRTSGRHYSLKPIGLMFGMDDRVVLEIVRVGLRMGIAGSKLADGVREDCMRGALLDFTPGRCLPTLQDGEMQRYITSDPLTALPVQSGVATVLLQLVVGISTPHQQSPGSVLHGASTTGVGILVHRIRPTAELFEMLFAHAPVDDAARVHRYDHLFQEHLDRCGMPDALLAWQLHWTLRLPRHAVQAMECAWVSAVLGCSLPLVAGMGTWAQVRRDAQVQLAQVEAWTCDNSSGSPTTATAMTTRHGQLTTVTELKSLLSGEVLQEHTTNTDGGDRPRRHPSRRQHHEVVVQQAITRHGTDRRQQSSALWCVCGATLLGLTADCIGGAHTTATLAQRSLLYSFLSALYLRDDFGAAEAVDHTVQLWLLSSLWHNGTSMPMSDKVPHMLLSSAHSPVIPSFRAFMQTQLRLAKALCDAQSNCLSPPAWDTLFAISVENETTIAAASVTQAAWLLLVPLLDHPDVAQLWLRHSLFQPSASLLVWISSRLDPQDGEGLACYGRWLRALPPEAAKPVAAQKLLELQGRPAQKRRFPRATPP